MGTKSQKDVQERGAASAPAPQAGRWAPSPGFSVVCSALPGLFAPASYVHFRPMTPVISLLCHVVVTQEGSEDLVC